MSAEAPDLTRPVVGYRAWRVVDDGRLRSTGLGEMEWEPGANRAECQAQRIVAAELASALVAGLPVPETPSVKKHDAPAGDCDCGIYSWHDPERAVWTSVALASPLAGAGGPVAVGAVAQWGRIEVHADGMRSELARVVALAEPPVRDVDLTASAARYGVPLAKTTGELVEAASRYGTPVPRELLPDGEDESLSGMAYLYALPMMLGMAQAAPRPFSIPEGQSSAPISFVSVSSSMPGSVTMVNVTSAAGGHHHKKKKDGGG